MATRSMPSRPHILRGLAAQGQCPRVWPSSGRCPSLRFGEAPQFAPGNRPFLGLGLAAIAVLLAALFGFAGEAAERVRSVTAAREPVVVHDRAEGWAESPSLDATAADAFVAYQVTEGKYGRICLARVPRTSGGLGEPSAVVRVDGGREVTAWPSVALETQEAGNGCGTRGSDERSERIWVAWSSCRDGRWAVKACLVECGNQLRTLSRTTLSAPGGFQSQVRVKSACGVTCFVWVRWDRGTYSVLARTIKGKISNIIKVYQGPNPVGRPDVQIMKPDRILFAWDEYADGGFAIRARTMAGDDLLEVRTFDGPSWGTVGDDPHAVPTIEGAGPPPAKHAAGAAWEPRLAGHDDQFIIAWNAVASVTPTPRPRAWTTAAGTLDPTAESLPTDDTWRVRCFSDSDGRLYLAWTTRAFFRSTDLYIRRTPCLDASITQSIAFRLDRNFMNTFDCRMDNDLLVAWDYSGAVYLGDVDSSEIWPPEGPSREAVAPADVSEGADGEAGGEVAVRLGRPAGDARAPELGDWADAAPDEDAWASRGQAQAISGFACPPGEWPAAGHRHDVLYQGESLHVYFGDYHNHTSFSDGRAYPDISLLAARDCRRLDFAAITDHDVTATPGELAWTRTVADYLSVPGRFAALYGFEASKGWAQEGFGHWSVLFPGAGEVLHFEPGMTAPDLYRFVNRMGALAIPHHVAKRFAPHTWSYSDPKAEPVVEMCSLHGIFEGLPGNEGKFDMVEGRFVQDGLAQGYVFGLVGGSDSHNCFDPATVEVGLTGVYAPELTPRAILEAMARRRTFASTSGRTVVDFRCNGRFMGEEVPVEEGGLLFTAYAASQDSIVSAEIISGGEVVWRSESRAVEAAISWEIPPPDSRAYYYLRVTTSTGALAWSSPVWIQPMR